MAQKWAWEEEKVITSVTALPGHRLRIMLRTGSVLELNMANRLNSTRYYPLRDEALMASVMMCSSASAWRCSWPLTHRAIRSAA